jgi:3-methyl-2-oxobutanoate hydroxymethyltransferase
MADAATPARMTVPKIRARKSGVPLVCLTCYTTPEARAIDAFCDLVLVGDTLGVVAHGRSTTVWVTVEDMILHGKAVARGLSHALLVVDLPFGSYEASPAQAFETAARIMSETGCAAVKLEGGADMAETVQFLSSRSIPVVGHVGLRPQNVNVMGGYRVVGRDERDWAPVEADAVAVANAGAFAIVLEGMAEPLAARITSRVPVPTIGIGASAACDGQILVLYDILGLTESPPKFVKRYADVGAVIRGAAQAYSEEVRERRFPTLEHTYAQKKGRPEEVKAVRKT